jgi:hypothetical protein
VGKLPADVTVMAESALNSIGSHKIITVPYDFADPANVQGDYFWIKGAITEYDVTMTSGKGIDFGLSLTGLKNIGRGNSKDGDLNGNIESELKSATITMDFNIVNARTKQFIPGVHTKNSMRIGSLTDSHDFSFSIAGTGAGVNGSVTRQQGIHASIRLLIELSLVELIGKLRTYPYWICIHNGKIDNDLLEKMRSDFINFDLNKRLFYIQHLLSIIYPDVLIGDKNMKNTNQRIIEFKKDNNIIPYNSEINTELYTKLLIEIPRILNKKRGK